MPPAVGVRLGIVDGRAAGARQRERLLGAHHRPRGAHSAGQLQTLPLSHEGDCALSHSPAAPRHTKHTSVCRSRTAGGLHVLCADHGSEPAGGPAAAAPPGRRWRGHPSLAGAAGAPTDTHDVNSSFVLWCLCAIGTQSGTAAEASRHPLRRCQQVSITPASLWRQTSRWPGSAQLELTVRNVRQTRATHIRWGDAQ